MGLREDFVAAVEAAKTTMEPAWDFRMRVRLPDNPSAADLQSMAEYLAEQTTQKLKTSDWTFDFKTKTEGGITYLLFGANRA